MGQCLCLMPTPSTIFVAGTFAYRRIIFISIPGRNIHQIIDSRVCPRINFDLSPSAPRGTILNNAAHRPYYISILDNFARSTTASHLCFSLIYVVREINSIEINRFRDTSHPVFEFFFSDLFEWSLDIRSAIIGE